MIPFNLPPVIGTEVNYLKQAINNNKLCGDGPFTKQVSHWFEYKFKAKKVLLTPSCTAALELAAILIDIKEGDEVIMPSYTFVSTSNAFVLRGAKIVFIDIDRNTMNIDASKIEAAITKNTKAIVPVHYAGVSCDMDTIMLLAKKYQLWVVEDAAQGVMSCYKNKALGTLGHIGCFSFHETKNYTSGGEGGAILINDSSLIERAEIIREKGTDRSQFLKGQVDKYTWKDIGSSFLPSELQAAFLFAQLESAQQINERRLNIWHQYHLAFFQLEKEGVLQRPYVPDESQHNAHMYYLKLKDIEQRSSFIAFLKNKGISSVFHYIPLHSSPAGKKFGDFHGDDTYTTIESEKLVRLPLYYSQTDDQVKQVIEAVKEFFI
ncbi:dTDP-4-amino-4,6-dideoxygalactose transaminase [Pseudoalteromonas tunicata]|uniref:dTDP-4-amino-4,6-dideoxygalactose transaminase n=1 Tax=Pseudoalteromonas tunicata TaxID=314281 RepID=UPI00273DB978|nr:dTDP-4-amino-4,6-dideoxygalactose transaminase [Pseudoalteromonas tunicata]MDP5211682.1 dTDP-4-amino-4,6-dideoxygalactose transaminase [Pseudoalteromonas tunicata]